MTGYPPRTVPALSVIIPAYDEAERILPTLSALTGYLNGRRLTYDIVVVDDGSRDETVHIVETYAKSAPEVRVLRLGANRGKGAAVRAGMRSATGARRLLTDADGAAPIQELVRLEAAVDAGADVAIGSRLLASRHPGFTVDARWHRSVLGGLFNRFVQRLGLDGLHDTQCGFKLFRGEVAARLFEISRVDGYGFDLEILYLARRRGYQIAEVPINWSDQPGSKVRIIRDGLRMAYDLFSVRRDERRGAYGTAARR